MANRHLLRGSSSDLQGVAAKKLRNVSAWLRDYITAIKKGQMHPFTPIERKTREATRNEAWGPTGSRMNELAEASFSSTDCEIIFAVIQLRLGYPQEKWRNVYKALVLLEFLVLRGSEQCIQIVQEDIISKLSELDSFKHTSPEGQDQGVNVRYRAKAIRDLMGDKDRLQAERQAYQRKKKAYQGYSKTEMSLMSSFKDDQAITPRAERTPSLRRSLSESGMAENVQGGMTNSNVPKLMNAGETKGVSPEMNERNLAELKRLLDLPHNRYCADCQGGGSACRASWASINNGTFICFRCAGVHRGLGVHISKVRSCTLDTWLPEQVAFMAETGNHKANTLLEARLDSSRKPLYDSPELATFIRQKYEARAFSGDGIWPPSISPLNSARSSKRASEDGEELGETDDSRRSSNGQRKEPRLPGRRSRQGNSGPNIPRPLTKMVSVPLPMKPNNESTPSQPQNLQNSGEVDLMNFDLPELPSYSAPAGSLATNGLSMRDEETDTQFSDPMLAELSKIEIPYDHELSQATYSMPPTSNDLTHPNPSQEIRPGTSSQDHIQNPASRQTSVSRQSSLPHWRALRSQSTSSSAIFTTGALIFPDTPSSTLYHDLDRAQAERRLSIDYGFPDQLSAIKEQEVELGFGEESVQDWGPATSARTQEQPARNVRVRIPRKKSIGSESDIVSSASTPVVTPRLTGLIGPGPKPTWRQNQRAAGLTYNPVAMLSNFKPASYNPTQKGQPLTSLKESVQQLSDPQAGGNSLDSLVLHALADIPTLNENKSNGSNQNKPMTMVQQRMQMKQQLAT